jgi:hypothetical protein
VILKNRTNLKNQFYYYENNSKFHNKIREIFVTDLFFKKLSCYQEVPLSFLVKNYPNNKDAVDWWIDELGLIIELHGKQHYEAISFTKDISYFEKQKKFFNIKYRDNRKKTFLLNEGYEFLEISYKDISKINSAYLKDLIFKQ